MRIAFHDHAGKGRRIGAALIAGGHELVDGRGDVALIDVDVPFPPYSDLCDTHDRVLLYPHGGGHAAVDGQWPVHPNTRCRFVIGTGQADVLAACDDPVPVEVIGWPFCDLRPFIPTTPTTVLLAPQHTMFDGWVAPGIRESNARIHDLLAALPVRLVVRFVSFAGFGVEHLGITRQAHVDYRAAGFDINDAIAAIDTADVVVASEGTFPSLAIARGRPTVMYGQVRPDDHRNFDDNPHPAIRWDLYRDDVRYPLDADSIPDTHLEGLLRVACADDRAIAEWRSRFIGDQFDPETFVKTFDKWAA